MPLKGKRAPGKTSAGFLNDLIDASIAIKDAAPGDKERAYMAKHLVQCTLPHSDPGGDLRLWTRKNGRLKLTIAPYVDRETHQSMYPYGSVPRLILFWLVTEITRMKNEGTASRRIDLGDHLDGFMRKIGLDPRTGGGKRGDAKRLRDQMERLFRAEISFEGGGNGGWVDMKVAPKGEFWWKADGEQGKLWTSWIELGEDFYGALVASAIPVDLRALRALKRSPLALDLYALLAHKTWSANVKQAQGEDLAPIPWNGLHEQMGGEYARLIDFKVKVRQALKKIALVSGMKWDLTEYGLKVHAGAMPVAPKERQPKTIEGR